MIRTSFLKLDLFLFSIMVVLIGCKKESNNTPTAPDQIEEGSWITYSPYKWPHDGLPYSSDYFTVYSDAASLEMKKHAGEFADKIFKEILDEFNFENYSDFKYPLDNKKIDVYINRNHEETLFAAFWGSIIITVRSSVMDTIRLYYLFKHELTHAFEYLIEGTPELGTDVWFREGLAVFIGSGGGWNYIVNTDDLDNWITQNSPYPNNGNPITIHQWEDFPEGSDITGYYTVFDVVLKFILSSKGTGKSLQNVLALFYDVRNGTSFSDAFEDNFGVSLLEFETNIFNRLRLFLKT